MSKVTFHDSPAAAIRAMRRAAGLTQRDLASVVEVTVTTVSRWEGESGGAGWSTLAAVAEVCSRAVRIEVRS